MASGFASSPVATASYVINLPPTFTLVASPTSLNLVSGSNGTVKLTLTPQNGFGGSVNFACSGLPGGASCSFSPPTVTLSNASAITQLTIATSTQSALIRNRPGSLLIASVLAFAFLFRRSRLGFSMLVAVALACVGAALVSGCGAGGISNTSRAPVNAIVTVTANSGSVQQSTTLQLTVN